MRRTNTNRSMNSSSSSNNNSNLLEVMNNGTLLNKKGTIYPPPTTRKKSLGVKFQNKGRAGKTSKNEQKSKTSSTWGIGCCKATDQFL